MGTAFGHDGLEFGKLLFFFLELAEALGFAETLGVVEDNGGRPARGLLG